MTEYGIFSDEGLLEDGFYSLEEANSRLKFYEEDNVYVAECCSEHPEQPKVSCPDCSISDEDGDE